MTLLRSAYVSNCESTLPLFPLCCSSLTYDFTILTPLRSCSPMLSRHHPLTSFFPPSSSVPIHSSTYTAQTKAKISTSHWVSSSSHSAVEALTFFFLIPNDTLTQYTGILFYEKSIFTLRDCSETLLFLYFNSFALLCIHAAKLIQHVQSSGLRGILMEGVHSTTYCSVCLKCSTNQIALRPQRARAETIVRRFSQVFAQVTLPFFFCPPQYLSLSHSLTTPHLPSIHSSSSL